MEEILEFVFEIILEGSIELSTSRKVPMPLRVLAVFVLILVYGGLIALVAMIMQECWQEENMTAFWAVAIIGAGILLMIACAVRKKYKEVCEKKM